MTKLRHFLNDNLFTQQKLETKHLVGGAALFVTLAAGVVFTLINSNPLDGIFFSNSTPSSLIVCGDTETFTIEYINASVTPYTDQLVQVALPAGIEYEVGSITDISGHNVIEDDISDLNNPVFITDNLEVGNTLQFSIKYSANVLAKNEIESGNILQNIVTVTCNEGTGRDTTDSYNALYAALSIINVTPSSQTVYTGDTTTRSITIVNAGNGKLSSFSLTDQHGEEINIIGVNKGSFSSTKDTIIFSGTVFNSIGNGDDFFDTNESITITETIVATGCNSSTVSSIINAHWGCGDQIVSTSNSNAAISVSLKLPNLSLSADGPVLSCFGPDAPNVQTITLKNTGQGIAKSVVLEIFKSTGGAYNEDIFSRIDESTITYQVGTSGTPIPITPTSTASTRSDDDYSCLGANPIGKAVLSLPDLLAGQTYVIKWNMYTCCIDFCSGQVNTGWNYKVDYTDACNSKNNSSTKTGQSVKSGNMSLFTESPSDIYDGKSETFYYTISSHSNELEDGKGAHYELVFNLPAGLIFSGSTDDLKFFSGPKFWAPFNLNYDASARTVTAKYALDAPFNFPKSEISIDLIGDCASAGNENKELTMGLNINYVSDTTCTTGCSIAMVCNEEVRVDLHCPGPCTDGGMRFNSYEIERTNYGISDNNQDGKPDSNNSIDFNKIKTHRAMVGDTLIGTFSGSVASSVANPTWNYGYASSKVQLGTNLTAIGASIKVYDASVGSYLTCTNLSITSSDNSSNRTFNYDFSPSSLQGSCSDFNGYTFEDGDSVWVYTSYKITGNIGAKVEEVEIDNEFYLSNTANPTSASNKFQCDDYDGKFTLIGYFFKTASKQNITVSGCSKVISQNYYMSIGDCCSNYSGGDIFPYEYRNWGHIKQAKALIPENYEIIQIYFRDRRTKYANAKATQKVNAMTHDSTSGDTLIFDLEQYFEIEGGSLLLSDDGFDGTLYIEIAPTCDVPENTYQDFYWFFTFQEAGILGGQETEWYTINPDRVKFSPPALALSSPNPTIDGLEKTVTWEVNIKNTSGSSSSANSWLHLESPTGEVQILSVTEKTSGDTLSLVGDIYQIGAINKRSTSKFLINATYSNCSPEQITIHAGYECSAYPDNFSSFTCPYSTSQLSVEPKPAQFQVTIEGKSLGSCSDSLEVIIEISSTKSASVDSLTLTATLPSSNGITFVPGSGELKHPISENFESISDPHSTGNKHVFNTWEYSEFIETTGLPGIYQLDKNRVQYKFKALKETNYSPGDRIILTIEGKEPCGKVLPTINMAYDPSVKFSRALSSGATDDQGHSWGAAWGDYDGDGYDDLFVPEFMHWSGSYLYHNNGDGTFTKENKNPVTSDKGASAGATWGDYDNDGDLDLFVANNVRAVNHLYQNNGDGTFTKANGGEVSDYGGYCHNAAWVDFDNDGYLDLFVSDYMPTRFNHLYRNKKDGTFERITNTALSLEAKFTMGATWSDYDNDGDQDVFIPNGQNANNSLYRNDGNGEFIRVDGSILSNDGGNSTGSSWGDYDNDGDMDLYVTNASNQTNFFYVNNGDGSFTKNTSPLIVTEQGQSHGSSWADIDSDGDLDLFVANNDGNPNVLYLNDGVGDFYKAEGIIYEDAEGSMAASFADIDNDGDLDLFVANHGNALNALYTNSASECNAWVCYSLEGTQSNRSAVGAKIYIKASIYGQSVWQSREISTQTGGISAQNTLKAYFGLGDASIIDSVKIVWPSGFIQYMTGEAVNNCSDVKEEDGALFAGKAYYDENGDCAYTEGEKGIPGLKIEILPGPRYVTTNDSGEYSLYLEPGTYDAIQVVKPGWADNCSDINDVLVKTGNQYTDNDFATTATCLTPELSVELATTVLRRGFRNTFAVKYTNEGSVDAEDITLVVTFDNDIVPVEANVPWTQAVPGDSTTVYYWNLGTIPMGARETIMITDSVSIFSELGEIKETHATFQMEGDDCEPSNNSAYDYKEIIGSLDPNDKLVYPRGIIRKNDTLTYTIRFQNVGNYHASRVVIKDTLSEELDYSTFKMGPVSHEPVKIDFSKDRVITWTFNPIHLPDSINDEPNSHGFVQFKILPRKGLPNGTEIRNTAAIQFDYNEYLITNTTLNKIGNPEQLAKDKKLKAVVFPNPVNNKGFVKIVSIEDDLIAVNIKALRIYNTAGGQIKRMNNFNHPEVEFSVEGIPAGVYIVQVLDVYGNSHSAKMIKK